METKECQICFNQISIKAKKCQFCLEWQDDIKVIDKKNDMKSIIDFDKKFSSTAKPFQKILIEKIPLPYFVSIFIIVTIIFVLMQFSWYLLDEDRVYLLSFLAFALQLVFTWTGVIWIYSIIKKNYDSFIKVSSNETLISEYNFEKAINKMFNPSYSVWIGIIIGLVASIGDYIVGTPFKTMEAKIIFATFEFIDMFFAGAALSTMLMFAKYLNHLNVVSEIKELSLEKSLAIKNIGNIHLKTSMLAVVPLFLGIVAKMFGYWSWDILIIIWYIIFAVLIIFYIFWPIQNIHELMVADIQAQNLKLSYKIEKTLDQLNIDPSSRNFRKLNELREWENSISNQNTWPFDYKSLWAIFLAIIFPILMMVMDRIWTN